MPNERKILEWTPWGPMYNSRRPYDEYLSVDYTTGIDTRWEGNVGKGPQFTVIDCVTVGGTVANANGMAFKTIAGVDYAYIIRGTDPARWNLATFTLTDPGISLAERATSVLFTVNDAGLEEISFGMAATAYRVITTFTPAGVDLTTANSQSKIKRILASVPDRVVGLQTNTFEGNVLDSVVSMVAPAWQPVAKYVGSDIVGTGFAVDGTTNIWGTTQGPMVYDSRSGLFRPQFMLLPPGNDNCRAMYFSPYSGVMIPIAGALLASSNGYITARIGPEAYSRQTSPILGTVTGGDSDGAWDIISIDDKNATGSGQIWSILAHRPRQEDDWHSEPLSYYCIGQQAEACEFVEFAGNRGANFNPYWFGGSNDDFWRFTAGRFERWFEDANYTYSILDQELHLTEIIAPPGFKIRPLWFEFDVRGATDTQYITLSLWTNDGLQNPDDYPAIGTAFGSGVTNSALSAITHRFNITGDMLEALTLRRFQPVLTFVTTSNTAGLAVTSKVRCEVEIVADVA